MQLTDCRIYQAHLHPCIAGIMVKNGDYHVSLDNASNNLFLSKNDPHITLYKHSDGTLRNEQGNKCIQATWTHDIALTGKSSISKHNENLKFLLEESKTQALLQECNLFCKFQS